MSIKKALPGRTKPGPRRRLTAANAKETILDAAEAILNAHGPQGLKLADIAKAAKVTNGNVLHHFRSIEGVHNALMTRLVKRLIDRTVKITQSPWTEDQRMTMAIREMFEAFEDKSASRLAAWLVMSDRTNELEEMSGAIGVVLAEIERARASGPRASRASGTVRDFVMLGVVNALAAGLFGKHVSRLFGAPETAARDVALGALLTLASRDQTHGQ